jgi:hypothetical protein
VCLTLCTAESFGEGRNDGHEHAHDIDAALTN